MTLPDIIAKVQYMKDRTWEIRSKDLDISLVEWKIFDVPMDVFKEAAKFYEVIQVKFGRDNRWTISPMPEGSLCRIIIFSEYIK
jgi:hypothetical protein